MNKLSSVIIYSVYFVVVLLFLSYETHFQG